MIHEIYPGSFNNAFIQVDKIKNDDYLLCYNDNKILMKEEGQSLTIPKRKDFSGEIDNLHAIYLFALNSSHCFLLPDFHNNYSSFVLKDIFDLRSIRNKEAAWIGVLGYQLMTWYDTNRYCGRCRTKTELKKNERAIICPNCGNIVYPKVSPAIIVTITSGDKILLARNTRFKNNYYSVLAGYVDIGESLEQTVVREVKEEAGIEIRNLRYYKSQPWPFSGSLMVGYFAEADDSQPLKIDPVEISEAGWYKRGNLPDHPTNISIAGEMIELFENGNII